MVIEVKLNFKGKEKQHLRKITIIYWLLRFNFAIFQNLKQVLSVTLVITDIAVVSVKTLIL